MIYVNNNDDIRQTAHVFDSTKTAFEFLEQSLPRQRFMLGEFRKSAIGALLFEVSQSANRLTNRFIVRQHAA